MAGEKLQGLPHDDMSDVSERLRRVSENLRRSHDSLVASMQSSAEARKIAGQSTVHVAPVQRGTARSQSSQLCGLADRLKEINRDTETEFLAIGSRLREFHQRSKKIADMCECIANLMAEKEVEKDIVQLNRIFKELKLWMESAVQESSSLRQRENASTVLIRAETLLGQLVEKHGNSKIMLKNISAQSDEMLRSVESIVKLLQYGDITLQHVGHFRSEIDSLAKRLDDPATAAEAGNICAKQASSLQHIKQDFEAAVDSIASHLRMVSRDAYEMSRMLQTVVKGDCEAGKSFLSSLGNSLSILPNAITASYSDAIGKVNSPLCGRPAEFQRLVDEVVGIVDSLRKINGNILYRLSIIDEEGGVLSKDIEKSLELFKKTSGISDRLDEVATGLREMAMQYGVTVLAHQPDESGTMRINDRSRYLRQTAFDSDSNRTGQGDGLGDNVELF